MIEMPANSRRSRSNSIDSSSNSSDKSSVGEEEHETTLPSSLAASETYHQNYKTSNNSTNTTSLQPDLNTNRLIIHKDIQQLDNGDEQYNGVALISHARLLENNSILNNSNSSYIRKKKSKNSEHNNKLIYIDSFGEIEEEKANNKNKNKKYNSDRSTGNTLFVPFDISNNNIHSNNSSSRNNKSMIKGSIQALRKRSSSLKIERDKEYIGDRKTNTTNKSDTTTSMSDFNQVHDSEALLNNNPSDIQDIDNDMDKGLNNEYDNDDDGTSIPLPIALSFGERIHMNIQGLLNRIRSNVSGTQPDENEIYDNNKSEPSSSRSNNNGNKSPSTDTNGANTNALSSASGNSGAAKKVFKLAQNVNFLFRELEAVKSSRLEDHPSSRIIQRKKTRMSDELEAVESPKRDDDDDEYEYWKILHFKWFGDDAPFHIHPQSFFTMMWTTIMLVTILYSTFSGMTRKEEEEEEVGSLDRIFTDFFLLILEMM